MRFVTAAEMREIDRRTIEDFGVPGLILMENAGRAVAEETTRLAPPGSRVLVVAGKGNNGGDGFAAARHLANRGYRVEVYALAPAASYGSKSDAGVHLHAVLRACPVVFEAPAVREWLATRRDAAAIVDAVFGTGLTGAVRGPAADAIQAINDAKVPVVCADIPSGLDADTGRPLGIAVRATVTVTMGLPKVGFRAPGASELLGRLVVAEIGFPLEIIT